eukprot:c5480_g1_i1.p1 GENE.c5480_g1_i1~~c5480_g1_i1.p1  ORF type:complete len:521 (+),score=138.95 c5480_g1_i1:160-1563(+)
MRDAETRRNAIQALVAAAVNFGTAFPEEASMARIQLVTGSLLMALEDFCVDNRGDVGSWVRIAAVDGVVSWFRFLSTLSSESGTFVLPTITCTRVIGSLIRLLTGRLDRVRLLAAKALNQIWSLSILERVVPHFSEMAPLFGDAETGILSLTPDTMITRCGLLLKLIEYQQYALEGWCTCTDQVNGFQRSSIAVKTLVEAISNLLQEPETRVCSIKLLLELIRLMQRRDAPNRSFDPAPNRMETPAVVTAARLLEGIAPDSWPKDVVSVPKALLDPKPPLVQDTSSTPPEDAWKWVVEPGTCFCDRIVWNENCESTTIDDVLTRLGRMVTTKLMAKDFGLVVQSTHILCALALAHVSYRKEALLSALYCLTDHPWPRLRKLTADQLYLHLIGLDQTDEICQISDIIITTAWIGPFEESSQQRADLYRLFGLDLPERVVVTSAANEQPQLDNDTTYADLVNDIARGLL